MQYNIYFSPTGRPDKDDSQELAGFALQIQEKLDKENYLFL